MNEHEQNVDLKLSLKLDANAASTLSFIAGAFALAWIVASIAGCALVSSTNQSAVRQAEITREVSR